jgi:predicted Rossmann-fold nucleotide-binding protein
MKALCVYCGSNPGADPEYAAIATGFGALLASKGITLVYGGGNLGLMGAVADGALGAGGRVIGVMPRSSMHERKMKIAELSDAFVALPGGMGTLEEIFEVCTWSQLGFHQKPCAFLNVAGFYSSLLGFLKHMVQERFMKEENYLSIIVESDPEQLLDRLASYRYVAVDKWLDRTVGA